MFVLIEGRESLFLRYFSTAPPIAPRKVFCPSPLNHVLGVRQFSEIKF